VGPLVVTNGVSFSLSQPLSLTGCCCCCCCVCVGNSQVIQCVYNSSTMKSWVIPTKMPYKIQVIHGWTAYGCMQVDTGIVEQNLLGVWCGRTWFVFGSTGCFFQKRKGSTVVCVDVRPFGWLVLVLDECVEICRGWRNAKTMSDPTM